MTEQQYIIVVEDDQSIAELIRYNLASESYQVLHFESGDALFRQLPKIEEPISLFILDVMLPGDDGFQICQKLKQDDHYRWSSFLFLTARSSEKDKLAGFAVGADDFLSKPFGMRELLARVRALTNRYEERVALLKGQELVRNVHPQQIKDRLEIDHIQLDDSSHRLFVNQIEVEITHREYELLKFFLKNQGRVFTRDDLLNHVWGYEYGGETRTVDVHIRQLRRKIEKDPANPRYIQTVRGVGYRFNDPSKEK